VTTEQPDVLGQLGVSRETIGRLEAFQGLLGRWNTKVNLVGKSTISSFWSRHILDSAQIFQHGQASGASWADLGSGGGLPGIVVAILAKELSPKLETTLVEADLRKAALLREAARSLDLHARVIAGRIEASPSLSADTISARALAPLSTLLEYTDRHLAKEGVGLFLKGANHEQEIDEARNAWRFDLTVIPSASEPQAAILKIRNIERASQN
jgi:16S rRNA (guanine527-N7)-methyltransferase